MLKKLSKRLSLCETKLAEKEEVLPHVHLDLHNIKGKLRKTRSSQKKKGKENEVDEIDEGKGVDKQLQPKNEFLERRVVQLEDDLLVKKEVSQDKNDELKVTKKSTKKVGKKVKMK